MHPPALLVLLLLAACAGSRVDPPAGVLTSAPGGARLGERIHVDGPQVTPLAVLADSRCPPGAACVWAGTVRLRATIHLGAGDVTRDLTLGEPIGVADGALTLVSVRPAPTGRPIAPADYRFALRFDGGI